MEGGNGKTWYRSASSVGLGLSRALAWPFSLARTLPIPTDVSSAVCVELDFGSGSWIVGGKPRSRKLSKDAWYRICRLPWHDTTGGKIQDDLRLPTDERPSHRKSSCAHLYDYTRFLGSIDDTMSCGDWGMWRYETSRSRAKLIVRSKKKKWSKGKVKDRANNAAVLDKPTL